jgi:3-methylcrotonyl-CoA carboxylase alpha subunit
MPILIDGEPSEAAVSFGPDGPSVAVDGVAAALDAAAIEETDAIYVLRHGWQTLVRRAGAGSGDLGDVDSGGLVRAPMHGRVLAVLVAQGDTVTKGQRLAVLEAMKMEHALLAPRAGRISEITVAEGSQVAERATLMTIESPGA